MTHYAEQYRFFEAVTPSFLRSLSEQFAGPSREFVEVNLADEISSPSHLEFFDRFARFYDARDVTPSPAMSRLIGAYADALERGPVVALAGLWAYESQGAQVADSRGLGLATHYGASEDAGSQIPRGCLNPRERVALRRGEERRRGVAHHHCSPRHDE